MDWSDDGPSHPLRVRVVLFGAGRVGTAVASLLQNAGHEIAGVASPRRSSAERAATRLRTTVLRTDAENLRDTALVLIGAHDRAIADAAAAIAEHPLEGTTVAHFAGSLGLEPLQPIRAAGGRACALHPVQACPDVDTAIARLPGSAWGVTTDDADTRRFAIELIARDLAGIPIDVAEEDRALWHGAAVTTSNGIAALMGVGEAMLTALGVPNPIEILGPLAQGTVANARAGGGGGPTLTGPVVRGELETIERHLDGVRRRTPDLLESYRAAVHMIVIAARQSGRGDPDTLARIADALDR